MAAKDEVVDMPIMEQDVLDNDVMVLDSNSCVEANLLPCQPVSVQDQDPTFIDSPNDWVPKKEG